MSAPSHQHNPGPAPPGNNAEGEGHGGHSMWLMVLCCIPMVIAVGVCASPGGREQRRTARFGRVFGPLWLTLDVVSGA